MATTMVKFLHEHTMLQEHKMLRLFAYLVDRREDI